MNSQKKLMLQGAKHAVMQMIEKGNCSFTKKQKNGKWELVDYIDIYDYLDKLINKVNVDILQNIKSEIEELPTYSMELERPNSKVWREVIEYHKVINIVDKHINGKG